MQSEGQCHTRSQCMAHKKKVFNAACAVRALARERIGQPKPCQVQTDKRSKKLIISLDREIRAARKGDRPDFYLAA